MKSRKKLGFVSMSFSYQRVRIKRLNWSSIHVGEYSGIYAIVDSVKPGACFMDGSNDKQSCYEVNSSDSVGDLVVLKKNLLV